CYRRDPFRETPSRRAWTRAAGRLREDATGQRSTPFGRILASGVRVINTKRARRKRRCRSNFLSSTRRACVPRQPLRLSLCGHTRVAVAGRPRLDSALRRRRASDHLRPHETRAAHSGPSRYSEPPMLDPIDDRPGRVLSGRYELVEPLGKGGMAVVWRGISRGADGFSRPVAIKRIDPSCRGFEEVIEMFVEEARVGGLLSHPNIVQVYDFG